MSEMEDSGALSSGGRFARMEAALERIESKLDTKADLVRLEALENHIRDIESGRVVSANTTEYLRRFNAMEGAIQNIQRDGSDGARRALQATEEQDRRLDSLERSAASAAAVQEALLQASNNRFRWIAATAALITIINMVLASIVLIRGL